MLKRWKKSTSSTINILKNTQYTINDARRKRESIKYALVIIKVAKTTYMSIFDQIILIYIDIDLELRRDLFKLTKDTTLNIYFQKLDNCKKI